MSGPAGQIVGVMKENLEEMNAQGVSVPVLLGGAALTRDYAVDDLAICTSGPLVYCKDAFEGLHAMDRILSGEAQHLQQQQRDQELERQEKAARAVKPKLEENVAERSDVKTDNPVPLPPFWGRREVTGIPLSQIFPYINTDALFLGQWGFKKKALSDDEQDAALAEVAQPVFERLQKQAIAEKLLDAKVVYGYFPVQSKGENSRAAPATPARANLNRSERPANGCGFHFHDNPAAVACASPIFSARLSPANLMCSACNW
jgi:5-methyltetrahydrofolate--homocysteine methyltransferase